MDRKVVVAGLLPALMLYACERAVSPPEPGMAASPATPENTGPTETAGSPSVDRPDLTPAELTPEAERGVEGARNVLLSFARALELETFDQAWAMLSSRDHQKWPKADFARQFADLADITVAVPTGAIEGAAGSSYYTAPLTISGTASDGRPVRYEGEAVLRRVNDVNGATPAQRRWHFDRLTLDWTH